MFSRFFLAFWIGCLLFVSNSQAFYINEILADPPAGLAGDANQDGVTSSTADEFLELYNPSLTALDISGWALSDALKSRHVFSAGTVLDAQGILVVFGGGTPNLGATPWQVASTGTLSLNNGPETVSLWDSQGQLVEEVVYGAEAAFDQSLVRSPEGTGEVFVQHLSLPGANGAAYSAGILVTPPEVAASPVVPEWPTVVYLLFSLFGAPLFRARWA